MDIFKPLFQKQEKKKHNLGVCIPDTSKSRRMAKGAQEEIAPGRTFKISGVFQVQDSLMVNGLSGGTIKKNDKVNFSGLKLVVQDVQVDNKTVEAIQEGEKGALFLKPEKGKLPILKIGDVLEF